MNQTIASWNMIKPRVADQQVMDSDRLLQTEIWVC